MIGWTTWRCDICHKERPDQFISVKVKPLTYKGQKLGEQNIKFCNDTTSCVTGAETFEFIKGGSL